jgi:hypothetical protein
MTNEEQDNLQVMSTYIDGKMRRYNLLFSVNGGAFAIAKLLGDPNNRNLVGSLTLQHLALGSIIFTALMLVDIRLWGETMRNKFPSGKLVFTKEGKVILLLLGILIIAGWLLAAFG